jgi:hypothetical protein
MKGTMRCGGMPGLLASTSLTPSFSSAWENREFEFFSSVSVATYAIWPNIKKLTESAK